VKIVNAAKQKKQIQYLESLSLIIQKKERKFLCALSKISVKPKFYFFTPTFAE